MIHILCSSSALQKIYFSDQLRHLMELRLGIYNYVADHLFVIDFKLYFGIIRYKTFLISFPSFWDVKVAVITPHLFWR